MRKFLIFLLLLLLVVAGFFMVKDGLNIGNYRILSWREIKDNNEKLDGEIENLEKLITVTFKNEQSNLNESYKQLLIKKNEYADLVLYSSESEIEKATRTEVYETEFLWTKLGNYATKNNGIDMKIDVVKGSSGEENVYNLNFTLVGEYVNISDFLSSIENDSKLGFRINNFSLVPVASNSETGNSNSLQATFTVENVGINL